MAYWPFPATGAAFQMFKPLVSLGLTEFVAATAGRNMTKTAYAAVVIGVVMIAISLRANVRTEATKVL